LVIYVLDGTVEEETMSDGETVPILPNKMAKSAVKVAPAVTEGEWVPVLLTV
jgi:hypothetical protein